MIEFLVYLIIDCLFWAIMKPSGANCRWVRSGFKRSFGEIWNDHTRENYALGAFVLFGGIVAVGVFYIIRDGLT